MKTLAAGGGSVLRLVVNSTGSAIVAWATENEIVADSGTILGGFAAPGPTAAAHQAPGRPVTALAPARASGRWPGTA